MPEQGTEVKCQFCGKVIPWEEEGVTERSKQMELKFRCCEGCRSQVVGPAGLLDRNTPGILRDRKMV
jgi:NAD-dependent SIR2 family protein deacetylase